MTCHVYFMCCFRFIVIIEHNLVIFSRVVLIFVVVAEARIVLKIVLIKKACMSNHDRQAGLHGVPVIFNKISLRAHSH